MREVGAGLYSADKNADMVRGSSIRFINVAAACCNAVDPRWTPLLSTPHARIFACNSSR